jgi:hypothetical protein
LAVPEKARAVSRSSRRDDHELSAVTASNCRSQLNRLPNKFLQYQLDTPTRGLLHNHPSGDPTPSKADIAVTKDIVNAGKPLGVTVHDHVIIGRGRHTSLRDMGLLS